jgi:hypothetical protein
MSPGLACRQKCSQRRLKLHRFKPVSIYELGSAAQKVLKVSELAIEVCRREKLSTAQPA